MNSPHLTTVQLLLTTCTRNNYIYVSMYFQYQLSILKAKHTIIYNYLYKLKSTEITANSFE